MRKLCELIDTELDINVEGIVDDSRDVKDNYVFVATKGFNVDHYNYIDDAIKNGCSFIICDRDINNNFPHLIVDNINDLYIELCEKYYDIDLNYFKLIGVTGTDGKTTTSTIIKNLILDCAYLGTNGLEVNNNYYSTDNTTPCISELYSNLNIIKNNNCSNISMEVSSEALLHDRVKNFKFDFILFTNITGDHLNVHKTYENYINSKLKLLNLIKDDEFVIVNGDDENLNKIDCKNKISVGFNDYNDWIIKDVTYYDNMTIFKLKHLNDWVNITSPFIGKYNIYNVALAYVTCFLYGISSDLLVKRISNLSSVSGRCEILDFGQDYKIVLDYAHTINGIKSILETFSNYDIITVTGCAGGREKEKRNIIGKMVIDNSFVSIFTMDDPRFEDVNKIIDDMVGDEKDYYRIIDREDAINFALNIACTGCCVLILGKGRDNYMAINDKKITYSDYDVIYNYFNKK